MKLILSFILIIVAGFSVNKYVIVSKAHDSINTVTDMISAYPVNIFDFKNIMEDYAIHLCRKSEATLNTHGINVNECLSQHKNKKLKCEKKVFRLAPLNLESEAEVLDYSRQYTRCTLPYKYILG